MRWLDKFYVYFTYGGNNGTVLYDDPTAENQTIYTANEPSVTTTATYINTNAPPYYNVTFSGSSTKVVDKNSTLGATTQGLTVGNNLTTSGGAVNLNTNNPTVTVGNSWTNSCSVTQGSGNITVTGSVTNNSGGALSLGTGSLSTGRQILLPTMLAAFICKAATSFNGTVRKTLSTRVQRAPHLKWWLLAEGVPPP